MTGLWLMGVRHHGPGSARSVVAALDEVQPDVVLIEAPAEASKAMAWIGNGLEPPVALLGYVRDSPQRAGFAPFARFSPEWQAVAWANTRAIPVTAIDLPLANTLADDDVGDDSPALFGDGRPVDPIAALAAAAGVSDAERWWEDVIERNDGPGLAAFAAVAEAMGEVREGTVSGVGEQRREAHMRTAIRAALKSHRRVAVVCGAWHVPALDVTDRTNFIIPTATADKATLRGLPKVKVDVSWVPWTHQRLAAATGYKAGVRSPGWYDHVFAHPGEATVGRFFVDAARVLRGCDIPASPDHLIAATRIAEALATMRNRPHPGLEEVLEAAEAVMGGLPIVRDRLIVGAAIGTVPDGAPQVPLARDIAAKQRSARLKPTAGGQTVEVDLRTPNGLRRSHLLHRMSALGVPWGMVVEGRGTSGTFRETWELDWQPEHAVRIVEHAGYGTTLETAATARLIEKTTTDSGVIEMARALDTALLADLAAAVNPIVSALGNRAATDPDIVALMGALGPLAQVGRYGDVRSTDAAALRDVFDGLVVRVIAGLVPACRSLNDEAAALIVERLSETQQALALIDHPARQRVYPEVLSQLATGTPHGLVRGRATRVLHDSGDWSATQVEQRFGQALSGGTSPAVGAAFVEGFLAGSGTVLLHDSALRSLLDRWLAGLGHEAFGDVIPLLRRTFGAFELAERRQLGHLVAGGAVETSAIYSDDLDPQRLAAVAVTMRSMLGLP